MKVCAENLNSMEIDEVRCLWQQLWGKAPHRHIRRRMLEKGISYKQAGNEGRGMTPEQQARLEKLIRQYRRDPGSFDQQYKIQSPGTILLRIWRGRKYVVTIHEHGFEYEGTVYSSLSSIATLITGTRWNGLVFFGVKKSAKGTRT